MDRIAIMDTAAARSGPLPGASMVSITIADVEAAECVLGEFIRAHNRLGRESRDSLFEASNGMISTQCLWRSWEADYRQYVGEKSEAGDVLIHINALCRLFPDEKLDALKRSWYWANDGGDCFFQATVNLSTRSLVAYSVNGPWSIDKRCP